MTERLSGTRLTDNPEENVFLNQLTNIERMLARNDFAGAQKAIIELKPHLNQFYESGVRKSDIFTNIENRIARIDWQLNPPDPRNGDET